MGLGFLNGSKNEVFIPVIFYFRHNPNGLRRANNGAKPDRDQTGGSN